MMGELTLILWESRFGVCVSPVAAVSPNEFCDNASLSVSHAVDQSEARRGTRGDPCPDNAVEIVDYIVTVVGEVESI